MLQALQTQRRTPKRSALAYAAFLRGRAPAEPRAAGR